MTLGKTLQDAGMFPCLSENLDVLFTSDVERKIIETAICKKGNVGLNDLPKIGIETERLYTEILEPKKQGKKSFHILNMHSGGGRGGKIVSIACVHKPSTGHVYLEAGYHDGKYPIPYDHLDGIRFRNILPEEDIRIHDYGWNLPIGMLGSDEEHTVSTVEAKKGAYQQRIKSVGGVLDENLERLIWKAYYLSFGVYSTDVLKITLGKDPISRYMSSVRDVDSWLNNAELYVTLLAIALNSFERRKERHVEKHLKILEYLWKYERLRNRAKEFDVAASAISANRLANTAFHNLSHPSTQRFLNAIRGRHHKDDINAMEEYALKITPKSKKPMLRRFFEGFYHGVDALKRKDMLNRVLSYEDREIESYLAELRSDIYSFHLV